MLASFVETAAWECSHPLSDSFLTMSCVSESNLTIKVKFALKSWLVPKQSSTVKSSEDMDRQRQRDSVTQWQREWVSLFGVCLLLMPFSSFYSACFTIRPALFLPVPSQELVVEAAAAIFPCLAIVSLGYIELIGKFRFKWRAPWHAHFGPELNYPSFN